MAKCEKGSKCASRARRGVGQEHFDGEMRFAMFRSAWRSAKWGLFALRYAAGKGAAGKGAAEIGAAGIGAGSCRACEW